MEMFIDYVDHAEYLAGLVEDKPKHVLIASFGLYCGITYDGRDTTQWGEKYQLETRDLMESMRELPDVRFLIGVADYRSCKDKVACIDCERQYCKQLIRLTNSANLFPEFSWRVTTQLHLKCALFFWTSKARGVAGGRNFSDSSWTDCTFTLNVSQIKTMYEHANNAWQEAREISDETIAAIFAEQHISERGFRAVAFDETPDGEPPF